MSFDVVHENRPTYSRGAMAAIVVLAAALVGLGATFAYLLITGKGNNYLLGTLLAFEFLIVGVEIVLFARAFVPFREVAEDRGEELLW